MGSLENGIWHIRGLYASREERKQKKQVRASRCARGFWDGLFAARKRQPGRYFRGGAATSGTRRGSP
jgi:hypothetical protein